MSEGAEQGLARIERQRESGELDGHQLLSAARADLLRRLGRHVEAGQAYAEALALALVRNPAERLYLASAG